MGTTLDVDPDKLDLAADNVMSAPLAYMELAQQGHQH